MTTKTGANKKVPARECLSFKAEETSDFGKTVGEYLTGGEIFLLSGPLGAGKTVFVKGLATALGIDPKEVTSPSFTLVNYHRGRLPLYHIDLYRLEKKNSVAQTIGLDEIIADSQAIVVIEWPENLGDYPLPESVWRVTISGDGDEPRRIAISN